MYPRCDAFIVVIEQADEVDTHGEQRRGGGADHLSRGTVRTGLPFWLPGVPDNLNVLAGFLSLWQHLLTPGMTQRELLAAMKEKFVKDKAAKVEEALGRRAKLTEVGCEKVKELHHRTASTIEPSRGRPSRIEGLRVGVQAAVVDVMGFPTERRPGDDDSMFPDPDGATAKARELDRADREPVLCFDVVAAPGTTNDQGDPEWPPETAGCKKDSGEVVKFLVEKGAGIFRVSYAGQDAGGIRLLCFPYVHARVSSG
jgi:hypothetical protein